MLIPYEASIISYRESDPPRRLLATYPTSIVDVLSFLPRIGWTHGVVSREDSAAGATRRLRHLERVTMAPSGLPASGNIRADNSRLDFTFSPATRLPRLKPSAHLWRWAVEHRTPYVLVHDNDHAWWCNVSASQQRTLFVSWLIRCALHSTLNNPIKVTSDCWRVISKGLSSHGWTLTPSGCEFQRGTLVLTLEPRNAIPLLSEVRGTSGRPIELALHLPADGYGAFRVGLGER